MLVLAMVFGNLFPAHAENVSFREAKLVKTEGEVMVRPAGSAEWVKGEKDMRLHQNDEILTGTGASATVIFDEEGVFQAKDYDSVDLMPGTNLRLSRLSYDRTTKDKKTLLDLNIGKIVANASKLRTKDSKFEVKTPTTIVGVRGTNYVVEYWPDQK